MAYYPYTKVQLSLVISFVINIMMMTNASIFKPRITEQFISDLPQNTHLLYVHCQSRDDDLKVHTLKPGDQFDFSFRRSILGTTHFHCNFKWDTKYSEFDVFYREKSVCKYHEFTENDLYCTWLVKDSAIFLARTKHPSPSPSEFQFAYAWA
ncbi:hypothetical protein T459_27178 [Capsicum annuum]|uniref:S-protein homolog n=1 Tax=Capsicum annuum TaxID=4072 RepID=A0A2G2YDR5_CAPAN|nr:S-protein homolog 21-like [Capsicum annuum]PHT67691.1 hypothetical protein T459_27178 [Capsicum annuum]